MQTFRIIHVIDNIIKDVFFLQLILIIPGSEISKYT